MYLLIQELEYMKNHDLLPDNEIVQEGELDDFNSTEPGILLERIRRLINSLYQFMSED